MKNYFKNQEFELNEILFENRNKIYGAYAIRSESDQILLKSMLIGIGFFAMVAVSPLILNALNTDKIVERPPLDGVHVFKDLDPIDEPIIIQKTTPPKIIVNTVDSRVPEPTVNAKIETVMPKQSNDKDVVIGTENISGEAPKLNYTSPEINITVPQGTDVPTAKPVDNSAKTVVDVQANFTGGIDAFRNKVINQFDTSAMDGKDEIVKTTVVFIVEKDGTISDVKASGSDLDFNRAAEKTIKSVRGKWIPAKLNGENVRSYFKFPISMNFE